MSRFNEEQIIDVLRQHEAGARIAASTRPSNQRFENASIKWSRYDQPSIVAPTAASRVTVMARQKNPGLAAIYLFSGAAWVRYTMARFSRGRVSERSSSFVSIGFEARTATPEWKRVDTRLTSRERRKR